MKGILVSDYRIVKVRLANLDMNCSQWKVGEGFWARKQYDQYSKCSPHLFFHLGGLSSLMVLRFQCLHFIPRTLPDWIFTISIFKSMPPFQSILKFSFPVWIHWKNFADVIIDWHNLNTKKTLYFHNPGKKFFYLSMFLLIELSSFIHFQGSGHSEFIIIVVQVYKNSKKT